MEREKNSSAGCLVITGHIKAKKTARFENEVAEIHAKKRQRGELKFLHTFQKNFTDVEIKTAVRKNWAKIILNECSCGLIKKTLTAFKDQPRQPVIVLATKENKEGLAIPVVNSLSRAFEL